VKQSVLDAGFSSASCEHIVQFFLASTPSPKKPITIADERTLDPRFISCRRAGLPDVVVLWASEDEILIDLETDYLAFALGNAVKHPLIDQQDN
jgi:hypothetical protein